MRQGQKVKLKDIQLSEFYSLDFQAQETYELYFGMDGIIVDTEQGKDNDSVLVLFKDEVNFIPTSYIEESDTKNVIFAVLLDEGNDHMSSKGFLDYEAREKYVKELEENDYLFFYAIDVEM